MDERDMTVGTRRRGVVGGLAVLECDVVEREDDDDEVDVSVGCVAK